MDKLVISDYVKCFFAEYLQNTEGDSPSVEMREFINHIVEFPRCRLEFVSILVDLDIGSKRAEDIWLRGCDEIKALAICSAMTKEFSGKRHGLGCDEFRTYISDSLF